MLTNSQNKRAAHAENVNGPRTNEQNEDTYMIIARNFTRANRQPLTMDQIRTVAPSAFASAAHSSRSERYAYIPTSAVIEGMMSSGFMPFYASQSRTRVEDKKDHTKHMIRFRAPNSEALTIGQTFPEIVLINSHDGTSAYKLMAGLFRLVCGNGMIVADSLIGSLSIRHTGRVIEEVTHGSVEIVEHMPKVVDAVARWREHQLSVAEQEIFAEAAHTVRFADSEGHIDTPITPRQLLTARRYDDNSADLWSTFNRVQENVIKGGLTARNPRTLGRTSTRAVKGIDQDVKLNRALWTLGERMAALKG